MIPSDHAEEEKAGSFSCIVCNPGKANKASFEPHSIS
jgi:hypothetical protein